MISYHPHKYQLLFHKSNARFRCLIAGRRGGKSLAGAVEAVWYAANKPGSLGLILAPTYQMIEDIHVPLVFSLIPSEAIYSFNLKSYRLKLKNGSQIRFRSTEHENRIRGSGYDWAWLDEACFMDAYVWDVLLPGLTDKKGDAWVTTTPKGLDWVHKTFYEPAQQGMKEYEAWRFATLDNPYIAPEVVEHAQRTMGEQMFRQEYMASFERFEGLVYPDYDDKRMCYASMPEGVDGILWFVGIDVGFSNPTAILLIAEDAQHKIWVEAEVYGRFKTAPEIADAIRNMVGDRNIEAYIIDPSSKGTEQTSQMSMFSQLQENGIPVSPGHNDVRAGINRMTTLIRTNQLAINEGCTNTRREIGGYTWKSAPRGISNLDERPVKSNDHTCDALRYVVMARPDWFERPERDRYGRVIELPGEDLFTEKETWDVV